MEDKKEVLHLEEAETKSGESRQILTVEEAARELKVSERSLYDNLRTGNHQLEAIKIGRQWRIVKTW